MLYNTRVGASAVIVRDGAILLVGYDEPGVPYHYNLPGGGIEPGENAHDAVRREAFEEAGAEVDVGRLLLVWEYEPRGSIDEHHLKLVFECQLRDGSQPGLPGAPDPYQARVEWVPLSALPTVRLLPPIADPLLTVLRDGALDDAYLPIAD